MITDYAVRFYRWYQMGITDPHDLIWINRFYNHSGEWCPNLVLGAVVQAEEYFNGKVHQTSP